MFFPPPSSFLSLKLSCIKHPWPSHVYEVFKHTSMHILKLAFFSWLICLFVRPARTTMRVGETLLLPHKSKTMFFVIFTSTLLPNQTSEVRPEQWMLFLYNGYYFFIHSAHHWEPPMCHAWEWLLPLRSLLGATHCSKQFMCANLLSVLYHPLLPDGQTEAQEFGTFMNFWTTREVVMG